MTKRKTVSKYISVYWDYSTLKSIKESVEKLIEQYGENTTFQVVEEYGSPVLYVVAEIPETDEQMKVRIKQEEEQKIAREQYEKQQLDNLIKKYGTPSAGTNKE